MKKSDLKRLEKALGYYRKAQKEMEDVLENLTDRDYEYVEFGGIEKFRLSTESIVEDLLMDAANTIAWVERRIKAIKEQLF